MSGLVLWDDRAERVMRRVPASVLLVPGVHREAVDPDVGERVVIDEAGILGEPDAHGPESLLRVDVSVGHDEDEVTRSRRRRPR